MPLAASGPMGARPSIRLWPGVAAVALQWLVFFALPLVVPDQGGTAIIGTFVLGLVVIGWWLFFSRAPWSERLGAAALMLVAGAITSRVVHPSIANGMMGFMFTIYALPAMCLALVAWAIVARGRPAAIRRALLIASVAVACAGLMTIRTNGISGAADVDLAWRWTPTAEERLLAQAASEPLPPVAPAAAPVAIDAPAATEVPSTPAPNAAAALPAASAPADSPSPSGTDAPVAPAASWPGFRGPSRDSVVRGVRLATDWTTAPPVQLWRRPIGPGWSSFAVAGDRIYTQEQRGDDEVVSAYRLDNGEPVWRHRDRARFWESNAGAGPRGTPTLSGGRVYTLGGTGILNALDSRTGAVLWSHNVATDTGRRVPDWGIAGSPLVVDGVVVVAAGGWLAAYEAGTGKARWFGPKKGAGYSSPQLTAIDGVQQVVLLNGSGVISVAPSDGKVLWQHTWPSDGIVQPAVMSDGLLIGSGSGMATNNGMLRVAVAHNASGWHVSERWTSSGLKPYFNDFVVHAGHAFGFDGSILACINLEDGTRQWKGGRFGHGQLLLLPEQNLLLVLSEEGELALVSATPDKFTELARVPAIEGKTWNHPVLVGDTLLVRNGEEMAAFRLTLEKR
ncbi:MAG: PQQ-binding-like beta-propeller repeat protein [Vicinamibacterales bacterium]